MLKYRYRYRNIM